jgi:hypothetical protein
MIVKIYTDVYIGWDPTTAWYFTEPKHEVPNGAKRLCFTFEVPDSLIVGEVEQTIEGFPAPSGKAGDKGDK